jgi:hypothetical protein
VEIGSFLASLILEDKSLHIHCNCWISSTKKQVGSENETAKAQGKGAGTDYLWDVLLSG